MTFDEYYQEAKRRAPTATLDVIRDAYQRQFDRDPVFEAAPKRDAFTLRVAEAYPNLTNDEISDKYDEIYGSSLTSEAKRSALRGMGGVARGIGAGLQMLQEELPPVAAKMPGIGVAKTIADMLPSGQMVRDYWKDKIATVPKSAAAQGDVLADPGGTLSNPLWWAAGVPEVAASQAATIGGYVLGGPLGAGLAGGYLEGASTYGEAKDQGLENPAARGIGMGLATGGLNALPFLRWMPKGGLAGIGSAMVAEGVTEGLEEIPGAYLESPYAAWSDPAVLEEGFRRGVNVAPLAAVTGGANAMVTGGQPKQSDLLDVTRDLMGAPETAPAPTQDERPAWVQDLAAKGQAPYLPQPGVHKTVLPKAEARRVALESALAPIYSKWQGGPKVHIVGTFRDLPKAIQDRFDDSINGAYDGVDNVYLVADKFNAPQEAARVLWHESLGHYSIEEIVPDIGVFAADVARLAPADPVLSKFWEEVQADPGYAKEEPMIRALETVAKYSEQFPNTRHPLVERLYGRLREFGRTRLGLSLQMNRADLNLILRKALRNLEQGTSNPTARTRTGEMKAARAWHGSPHEFDKFDLSKMGTGEGAQVYGAGHYLAGRKEVAEFYRKSLSGNRAVDVESLGYDVGLELTDRTVNRDIQAKILSGMDEGSPPSEIAKTIQYGIPATRGMDKTKLEQLSSAYIDATRGHLYEVEIPDDGAYLLWDKPLSEQPESVRNALRRMNKPTTLQDTLKGMDVKQMFRWARSFDPNSSWDEAFDLGSNPDEVRSALLEAYDDADMRSYLSGDISDTQTGQSLYLQLASKKGDVEASKTLKEIGIPGIKYLDGSSRRKGEGSYNYVIFDDADAKILSKASRPPPSQSPGVQIAAPRRAADGRIFGGPSGLTSQDDYDGIVNRVVGLALDPMSVPDRSAWWYEESGRHIAEAAPTPELAEKAIRLAAYFSQASSLGANTAFTVDALFQIARGVEEVAAGRFPAVARRQIRAILDAPEMDKSLPGVNDKIMSFYRNLKDGATGSDQYPDESTIDRWMWQLFGYSGGRDHAAGAAQYAFARSVMRDAAQRLSAQTGQRYLPRNVQAMLWTYERNTENAQKAAKKGTLEKFQPVSLSMSDYLENATATVNYEAVPSTSLPHYEKYQSLPEQERTNFLKDAYRLLEELPGRMGMPGAVRGEGRGAWEGVVNPNAFTGLLLPGNIGQGFNTSLADVMAAATGYITRQDAVLWHRPAFFGKPGGTHATGVSVLVDGEEKVDSAALARLLAENGVIGFSEVTRGDGKQDFRILRLPEEGESKAQAKEADTNFIKSIRAGLMAYPSQGATFRVQSFRSDWGMPSNNWQEQNRGEGYMARIREAGFGDLQEWVSSRGEAFDALLDAYVERQAEPKASRPSVVARAKALGLPATGTTEAIANRVRIVTSHPSTWSRVDFDAISPYLWIHQDIRDGSAGRVESIMRDGLQRGMVDNLQSLDGKGWAWAKKLLGGHAYVFAPNLKFQSGDSPYLAAVNKPLFVIPNTKGQDIFSALQSVPGKAGPGDPSIKASRPPYPAVVRTFDDRALQSVVRAAEFSPEVLQAYVSIAKGQQGRIETQRRGVQSWSQTQKGAADLLASDLGYKHVGSLVAAAPGSAANPESLMILAGAVHEATEMVESAAAAVMSDRSPANLAMLKAAMDRLAYLQAPWMGYRAEAGRALNILRKVAPIASNVNQLLDAYVHDEQRLEETAAVIVNAKQQEEQNNPGAAVEREIVGVEAQRDALQQELDAANAEMERMRREGEVEQNLIDRVLDAEQQISDLEKRLVALEARRRQIPKQPRAPRTTASIVRNQYTPTLGDKFLEYYYNSILSGPATHLVNIFGNAAFVVTDEIAKQAGLRATGQGAAATARLKAITLGIQTGLRNARTAFATELPQLDQQTKMEIQPELRAAIPGTAGRMIRLPGRALQAEDEFFKGIAYTMELAQLAVSAANGDMAQAQQIMANPPQEMAREAVLAARRTTFTSKVGPAARTLITGLNKVKPAKLIIPFVQTPVNIFKRAMDYSPFGLIGLPFNTEIGRDLRGENGPEKRAIAISRQVMGGGIALMLWQLAAAGLVTGGGPPDPDERTLWRQRDGRDVYSVKIGDKWVSYLRFDPLAIPMGVMADLYESVSMLGERDAEDIALTVMNSLVNNITNKTWLSGVSSFAEALNDPQRYGGSFLGMVASGIAVPNIIGQTTNYNDPYVRQARTILDRVRSRLPGERSELAQRIGISGEPLQNSGVTAMGVPTPLRASDATAVDPLADAMLRLDVIRQAPSRDFMGVELTDQEHADWITQIQQARWKNITPIVQSPQFNQLPPIVQAAQLEKLWTKFGSNEYARAVFLMQNPQVLDRIKTERKKAG